MRHKRTRREERLIAQVKRHKVIRIVFSDNRERVIYEDGTAFFKYPGFQPWKAWNAPCWIADGSEYKQRYLKPGLRRTVRSMLAHDLYARQIAKVHFDDGGIRRDSLRHGKVS